MPINILKKKKRNIKFKSKLKLFTYNRQISLVVLNQYENISTRKTVIEVKIIFR